MAAPRSRTVLASDPGRHQDAVSIWNRDIPNESELRLLAAITAPAIVTISKQTPIDKLNPVRWPPVSVPTAAT